MTKKAAAYNLSNLVMLELSEKRYTIQIHVDDMLDVLTLAQNGTTLYTTLVDQVEAIRHDTTRDSAGVDWTALDRELADIHSRWSWT